MTVSTGATRSTVLKVSNALNPTDATVLLHVGTDHTGGQASSDAAMLTDRDYTFDPGASGDRGTLTITVPHGLSISDGDTIHVATVPLQTLTAAQTPYLIDLHDTTSPATGYPCPVKPDDLTSYNATLRAGATAFLPTHISGTSVSGEPMTSGISYRCGLIAYDGPDIIDLHYTLTNSTDSALSNVTLTFDLTKDPVHAPLARQLSAESNSYGQRVTYDERSHALTVTYTQPLAAGSSVNDLQIYLRHLPLVHDDSAGITFCVVRSADNKALVTATATSASEFPKTWSGTFTADQWIADPNATDVLDPLFNFGVVRSAHGTTPSFDITNAPSSESMQGMVSIYGSATARFAYHHANWAPLQLKATTTCE